MDSAKPVHAPARGPASVGATAPRPPVVVITGASAGVGRATARALAPRGARIGLLARGRDGLDAAAGEVLAAMAGGLAGLLLLLASRRHD